MLKRPFPRPKYKVLSDAVVAELLGGDIDVYTDLAPFFLAAVMSNRGQFNPAWLDLPHFAPVREKVSTEQIVRVYTTRLPSCAARRGRSAIAGRSCASTTSPVGRPAVRRAGRRDRAGTPAIELVQTSFLQVGGP